MSSLLVLRDIKNLCTNDNIIFETMNIKKTCMHFQQKSLVNKSIDIINHDCHIRNHRFHKFIFDPVRAKCHNINNLTSQKYIEF